MQSPQSATTPTILTLLLDKNEKKVEEGMSGLNEADKEAIDNDPSSRQARGFCKDSYGVFCMLYNALAGSKAIFTYQFNKGQVPWGKILDLVQWGLLYALQCLSSLKVDFYISISVLNLIKDY